MSQQRELITDSAEIEEAQRLAQQYWKESSLCGCLLFTRQSKDVLIPLQSKEEGGKERWVCVNMVDHKVYNVDKQPDDNKVAIEGIFLTHPPPFGGAPCGPNYVYSENFQSIQFLLIYTIVFAVIMTILSTPLCLICFIPAILLLNKVCTSKHNNIINVTNYYYYVSNYHKN